MFGKYSEEGRMMRELLLKNKELEEIINRKEEEILDIKEACAEEFEKIKRLCYCNNYNGQFNSRDKIYEIANDNFVALAVDVLISKEEGDESKIIELSNTRKSSS